MSDSVLNDSRRSTSATPRLALEGGALQGALVSSDGEEELDHAVHGTDYPYHPPRVDQELYQARVPPLRTLRHKGGVCAFLDLRLQLQLPFDHPARPCLAPPGEPDVEPSDPDAMRTAAGQVAVDDHLLWSGFEHAESATSSLALRRLRPASCCSSSPCARLGSKEIS